MDPHNLALVTSKPLQGFPGAVRNRWRFEVVNVHRPGRLDDLTGAIRSSQTDT
jgi:hypothetical protein